MKVAIVRTFSDALRKVTAFSEMAFASAVIEPTAGAALTFTKSTNASDVGRAISRSRTRRVWRASDLSRINLYEVHQCKRRRAGNQQVADAQSLACFLGDPRDALDLQDAGGCSAASSAGDRGLGLQIVALQGEG